MAHEPLKNRPLFSIQFLVDLSKITDINRFTMLLIGLLGDAEPTEVLSKLELIREELLRPPIKGDAPPKEKVDAIIDYIEGEIEDWRCCDAISR